MERLEEKILQLENKVKDIKNTFMYQNEINIINGEKLKNYEIHILFEKIVETLQPTNKYFMRNDTKDTTYNKYYILYKILKYHISPELKNQIIHCFNNNSFIDSFLVDFNYDTTYFKQHEESEKDKLFLTQYWYVIDLKKYYYSNKTQDVSFYCINYEDNKRRDKMIRRFQSFNFELQFVSPVHTTDVRIQNLPKNFDKRIWSIMLQHLDSIQDYLLKSDKEYLIVCEDDVLLSTKFKNDLPEFILSMEELGLDILLLGYLMDFKFERKMETYPKIKNCSYFCYNDFPVYKKTEKYLYCNYHYSLWGSQMYLITKKHAQFLVNKYTILYGVQNPNVPFNPDWTLTKDGKKALLTPMVAVEEGNSKLGTDNQTVFHERCFINNYKKNEFI